MAMDVFSFMYIISFPSNRQGLIYQIWPWVTHKACVAYKKQEMLTLCEWCTSVLSVEVVFLILLVPRFVFFFLCLCSCYLLCPMLPVSIGFSFLIAPTALSYGFFHTNFQSHNKKEASKHVFFSVDIIFIIVFTSKTIKWGSTAMSTSSYNVWGVGSWLDIRETIRKEIRHWHILFWWISFGSIVWRLIVAIVSSRTHSDQESKYN